MIPNIVHFVYGLGKDFGGIPFCLPHFLAIKSAFEVNRPEKIFMHCKYEPKNNVFWERAKSYFELVVTEPPKMIYGNPIYHYAHATDVVRLNALNWVGGIYLDIDTLCVKPLDSFFGHDFVMGKQHDNGLCNAVILAKPKSEFGRLWLESFCTFEGHFGWDEHACKMPKNISVLRPDLIHVEPCTSFFYPTPPDGLGLLYHACIDDMTKNYTFHLWEHCAWEHYLSKVDENWIKTSVSTYAMAARRFL
jgi:hypothetical protein